MTTSLLIRTLKPFLKFFALAVLATACAGETSSRSTKTSTSEHSGKSATLQQTGQESFAEKAEVVVTNGGPLSIPSEAPPPNQEGNTCSADTTTYLTCEALKAALHAKGLDHVTVIITVATSIFMQNAQQSFEDNRACILNVFRSVQPRRKRFRFWGIDDLQRKLEDGIEQCAAASNQSLDDAIRNGVATANQMAEAVKKSIPDHGSVFLALKYLTDVARSCITPDVKVILRLPSPNAVAASFQALAVQTFNDGIQILRVRQVLGLGVNIIFNTNMVQVKINSQIASQTLAQIRNAYSIAATSLQESTGFPVRIEYVGQIAASSVVVQNAQGQPALTVTTSLDPSMSRGEILSKLLGQLDGRKPCIEIK